MIRKSLIIIISIISLLLGIFVFISVNPVIFSQIERHVIFKPEKETFNLIPSLASKAEEKSFISADGNKINYLRIKGNKTYPVIVFCHGNSGNMTRNDNQYKIKFLAEKGYEIYTLDYRGFGKSTGEPDEKGVYKDLDSLIILLNNKYKIPDNKIVLWGHSLGSAIAINEASRKKFEGVIIEGAFTSAQDMRDYRVSSKRNADPVHLFIRDSIFNNIPISQKFSSKDKVARIKSPTLIIHAVNDEMIPVSMGKQLAKLKPNAETYFSKVGHHCDYGWQNKSILEFLRKLN